MINHTQVSKLGDTALQVRAWKNITLEKQECNPLDMTALKDATVQIDGPFGMASVIMMGSNDGVSYHLLRDSAGFPLSFKKPGIYHLDVNVWFVRPYVQAPDNETNINVTLCARRLS